MTSKEALEKIKKLSIAYMPSNMCLEDKYKEEFNEIQKDLQVLEIIKNKLVFPLALMSLPYELYNNSVMKEQQLTQEEYDKIKEWLENE